MKTFSFYDFLRRGEMLPVVLGISRIEILELLGTPSGWVSRDDPLFQTPRRDFLRADSISFGSLILSFDVEDRLESIMLAMSFECSWPGGAMDFPSRDTTITEVADAMRRREIAFDDVSVGGDGSMLRTSAGVEILASAKASDEGRLLSCHSQVHHFTTAPTKPMTPPSLFSRSQPPTQLSPQEACEVARSYFVTRKRLFPHRGHFVSPAREDLLRFIEKRTEFIHYWIGWSEDKRWSPAWFFRTVDPEFEIGRLNRDGSITQSRLYASPAEACADFILKELDEERA